MTDQPALAPEPAEPVEETYKAGPSEVLGNAPGSTFKATLDPVQEARLIEGGAITKVGTKPAEPKRKAETPAFAPPAATPPKRPNPPATPSGPTSHKE